MNNKLVPDPLKSIIVVPSHIPEDVNNRIDDTLSSLENIKHGRGIKKGFTSIVLAACLLITCFSTYAALGGEVPLVKSIIRIIYPEAANNYEELKTDINKSVTDKDITFTVNSVSYDRATLFVGYSVHKAGGFDRNEIDVGVFPGIKDADKPLPWHSIDSYTVRQDKDNYTGYASFYSGDAELAGDFKLTLTAREIQGVSGSWKVDIDISEKDTYVDTVVTEFQEEHKITGGTISSLKIVRSKLNNLVRLRGTYRNPTPDDMKTAFPGFFILDEKGNCLNYKIIEQFVGQDNVFNIDISIMKIPDGTKKLKVVPYRRVSSVEKLYSADVTVLPAVIKAGEGEINIYKIDRSEGKLKLYYTINGLVPERFFTYFDFTDKYGKKIQAPASRTKPIDYNTGIGEFEFETSNPNDIVKVNCYGFENEVMSNCKFDLTLK